MSGFGDLLTPAEESILMCFKTGKLCYPSIGLTVSKTNEALDSLKRKGIVKGRAPFLLTRKGARLYRDYTSRRQKQEDERNEERMVCGSGGD